MANVRRTAREIRLEAIIALQNELNQLKGEAPVDEKEIQSYDGYKLYELGEIKESLAKQIDNEKLAQKVAAYFAGEGADIKAELERRYDEVRKGFMKTKNDLLQYAEQTFTETAWTVESTYISFGTAIIELSLYDEDGKRVSGTGIEIRLEHQCWRENGIRFTTNVGTNGSFDLLNESPSSRAYFYIQIGELLKNKEKLEDIQNTMDRLTNEQDALRKMENRLDRVKRDPFTHKLDDKEPEMEE